MAKQHRIGNILAYLLIFLCVLFLANCGKAGVGRIEILPTEADFGTIPNNEPVSKVFMVRNSGDGDLEITRITTSCSCTTATISKENLAPDEEADLTITFDPVAHNGATGQFLRKVFIQSTDPDNPETVFTFRITVIEN